MSFKVMVICGNDEFTNEYFEPTPLSAIIRDSGFSFDMPCGGRGICGNCKVYTRGTVSDASVEEASVLGIDTENGARLSCKAYALDECVITIPKSAVTDFKGAGISTVSAAPTINDNPRYACAVDVGTTTIAFSYFALPEGRLVFSDYCDNPQRIHGSDVITRIDFQKEDKFELTELINKAIDDSAGKFGKKVDYYVISANTVMMHFLAGYDASGIAVAPFVPKSLFGEWIGNRYYLPCADAYIGGDAVASVLDSDMIASDEPSLLIDVGTNNECFLWDGRTLFACSTPAGPAFEGASISCGMPAKSGAICRIKDENNFETIGNENPLGICGSAMVDALAFLLKNSYISFDGSVIKDLPSFGSVKLTPEDIAQLQLAKSAICSGILTLIKESGIDQTEIKRLYITGSFGRHMNFENARFVGLIPECLNGVALTATQGAISGASKLLLDRNQFKRIEGLARDIKVIELADSPFFAEKFIENLYFEKFE